MERSEKQERSDIVYIELDGESTGAGGGRVAGPAGTERDGERKREQSGRGEGGGEGDRGEQEMRWERVDAGGLRA